MGGTVKGTVEPLGNFLGKSEPFPTPNQNWKESFRQVESSLNGGN